jgi:hypothetical protein
MPIYQPYQPTPSPVFSYPAPAQPAPVYRGPSQSDMNAIQMQHLLGGALRTYRED